MFKKNIVALLLFIFIAAGCSFMPMAIDSASAVSFPNPIHADTVSGLVGAVLTALRGVIVSIALVFIVVGAIMYIFSAGDDKKMTTAKNTITAALIGLAIAVAAPVFLREILHILGNTGVVTTDSIPGNLTLAGIARNVLQFLLSIVGTLSIIGTVVGGFFYMTAYGDEKRAETGKKIITASLIGIAVAAGAMVLVAQVAGFFGVS